VIRRSHDPAKAPDGPPIEASDPDHDASPQATVERLAQAWEHRQEDLNLLLDRACGMLAERAGHELRQALFIASTELQLLQRRDEGSIADARGTLERIAGSLSRAETVVDNHLDRNEVAKMLIQLDPTPLDLSEVFETALERYGLARPGADVDVQLGSAKLEADRRKIGVAVDHVVSRFAQVRSPQARFIVRVRETEDGVWGFVGLDPCPASRTALLQAINETVDLASSRVDLPYTRAVVECHEGTLFVDSQQGARGLSIVLPERRVDE
jgi:light-regulated signal transduction histidine kinase (bacteriophytochrome)